MDVDAYCERTAPGLWNEPANAVSNVAFLIASALLLWLLAGQAQQRGRPVPRSIWVLPVLLGVVGLCSLAFHTFATVPTAALDSLSIVAFILAAVVVLVHWVWRVPWRRAWLVAPVYMLGSVAVNGLLAAVGGDARPLAATCRRC